MSLTKRILFTIIFVLATLVVPVIIIFGFLDSTDNFSLILILFILVMFASIGYLLASIISIRKEFSQTLEEIKKQNAAIAFKLSGMSADEIKKLWTDVEYEKANNDKADNAAASLSTPLNPADPLVMPEPSKKVKDVPLPEKEEKFDDFQ